MKKKNNYNIDFVVATNNLHIAHRQNESNYDIDCPFCNRRAKLHINVDKNVWRCPACDESGFFLDLHAKIHNKDRKWAIKDLNARFNGLSEDEQKAISVSEDRPKIVESSKAYPLKERSFILKHFLATQTISDYLLNEMAQNKRGNLAREQILKLGYREFSNKTFDSKFGNVNSAEYALCQYFESIGMVTLDLHDMPAMIAKTLDNKQIPGFKRENGRVVAETPKTNGTINDSVVFLPVRARTGDISFFQTMFPKLKKNANNYQKDNYKKYGRYASFGDCGCNTSNIEAIHYSIPNFDFDSDKTPETVWLTEGVLKSDIASLKSNRPFIALLGIANTAQLPAELEYLKQHGTKKITIAIDMDYLDKLSVANALAKITNIINHAGLQCDMATWNPEYKGIDDFLIAVTEGKPNLEMKFTDCSRNLTTI